MIKKVCFVFMLCAITVLGYIFQSKHNPQNKETDIAVQPPQKTHIASTSEQPAHTCNIEKRDTMLPGRQLFVDPECRFTFEYIEGIREYSVERNPDDPFLFSMSNGLRLIGVGVHVTPLKLLSSGYPVYDSYIRRTPNWTTPDTFEKTVVNNYLAYRAVFRTEKYPERYLFIHIPHDSELFTLFRSTTDSQVAFEQFDVITETFTFLE